MRRGKRTALLAGPFVTHTEALATVDRANAKACEVDQWAWFDLFGTMSLPRSATNPIGKLNALLGIAARCPVPLP
jgi:hypothetical protein